jgi:hypothetical protein
VQHLLFKVSFINKGEIRKNDWITQFNKKFTLFTHFNNLEILQNMKQNKTAHFLQMRGDAAPKPLIRIIDIKAYIFPVNPGKEQFPSCGYLLVLQ